LDEGPSFPATIPANRRPRQQPLARVPGRSEVGRTGLLAPAAREGVG